MTDLERILDLARSTLVGASEALLRRELFEVYHEFFNDASCWLEHLPLKLQQGVTEYNLVTNPPGQIVRHLMTQNKNGSVYPSFMPDFTTLVLRDQPNQIEDVTVTVIKNVALPTSARDIPEVPDWVLPKWGPAILDGLLGKMMAQPKKSYSDNTLSVFHLRRFRDGVNRARAAALHWNTYGVQSWAYPQNFRTRGQRGGVSVGNEVKF